MNVKCFCGVCNQPFERTMDHDIFQEAAKIRGALDGSGRLIVACDGCHPITDDKSWLLNTLNDGGYLQ